MWMMRKFWNWLFPTVNSLRQLVRRDAEVLDHKYPGWANKINTRTFDMSGTTCVLYQLYGTYGKGMQKIGYSHKKAHSFFLPARTINVWDDLTDMWLEEIQERKED